MAVTLHVKDGVHVASALAASEALPIYGYVRYAPAKLSACAGLERLCAESADVGIGRFENEFSLGIDETHLVANDNLRVAALEGARQLVFRLDDHAAGGIDKAVEAAQTD